MTCQPAERLRPDSALLVAWGLLGTVVQWLVIIPVVGILAAGIWSVAVVMWVFEEVDGIERMQAFGISFATGILFWVILFALFGRFQ